MMPFYIAFAISQASSVYDSALAMLNTLIQAVSNLDQVMLSEDKLFVVLAVALLIWFGLIFFIFRTDRKLDRLERTLKERIAQDKD